MQGTQGPFLSVHLVASVATNMIGPTEASGQTFLPMEPWSS